MQQSVSVTYRLLDEIIGLSTKIFFRDEMSQNIVVVFFGK
jgi:hypothetical protein